VPGANGQGHTIEECRASLSEAIRLIMADRREDGLRGLPPEAVQETVTVQ
jgi:predicted RNase H-like HicB family nuclease